MIDKRGGQGYKSAVSVGCETLYPDAPHTLTADADITNKAAHRRLTLADAARAAGNNRDNCDGREAP